MAKPKICVNCGQPIPKSLGNYVDTCNARCKKLASLKQVTGYLR